MVSATLIMGTQIAYLQPGAFLPLHTRSKAEINTNPHLQKQRRGVIFVEQLI